MVQQPTGTILLCEAVHHHRDGSVSLLGVGGDRFDPGEQLLEVVVALTAPWADVGAEPYELTDTAMLVDLRSERATPSCCA